MALSLDTRSFIGSLILHGLIGLTILQWVHPILVPQHPQVVQVTLVAPTVLGAEEPNNASPSEEEKPIPLQPPEKKQPVKIQGEETPQPPQKQPTPTQLQQLTSGLTSPDAKNTVSAITKPTTAEYLNNPPPRYPEKARLLHQQGTVLLDILVDKNGTPKSIHIMESSGYLLLDHAALEKVRHWKFIPAKRGTQTIEAHVEIPITFRID